jgi:hypothetical protein
MIQPGEGAVVIVPSPEPEAGALVATGSVGDDSQPR